MVLPWVVTGVALACAGSGEAPETADLVLRGGRVVTLDERRPEATAVAIRGARIAAVGTDEEVARWIGGGTRVVELAGRLTIPGFIEGHGHFLSLGDSRSILDLTAAASWEEIVAMVAEAAAGAAPGEWIRGRGWHQEKWSRPPTPAVEGSPVHAALSAASSDNPVILTHASGHAAFANERALALSGLTDGTPDPPGGQLVRDAAGHLTGLLREAAQLAVEEALAASRAGRGPAELEAEWRRLVELAGREALAKGVTSFHDAGSSLRTIDFYRRLEEEGALPIRLYVMIRDDAALAEHVPGAPRGVEELEARLPEYWHPADGDDYLAVRSFKLQIDGALGSHGAWLLEPYADMPGSVGLVLQTEEEIRAIAGLAIRHGFQVNTHAIGDRANRAVLDLYEQAFAAAGGPAERRWRIEHAQHLHPDDVGRFAQLGVIASMQGIHCTSDGPWIPLRLGAERARSGAYLWRALLDSGAVVTNGTDVPVEDVDPIASFHASVSRRMRNGEAFYPEQRMTRLEALRSYTISNAWAAFEEEIKGSIEAGKLADLVVLSRDILTVPEEELPGARVELTVLGGRVAYERPAG